MTNEKNEKAVVPSFKNGDLITIDTEHDLISLAQRRTGVISEMIKFALHETHEGDWIDQGGNPYLKHSGAERIALLFGVKRFGVKTEKFMTEDSKGKYFIWKTTGTLALPGKYDSIEALGTCSQRDKFWAYKDGKWRETLEIDETNIMKKSFTNFMVNGITHLLGLRNIPYEQLANAGINISKIQKVEYKSGSQKTTAKMSEDDLKSRQEIWDICMKLAAGSEEDAKGLLKTLTYFKTGKKVTVEGREVDEEKYVTDIKRFTSSKWITSTLKRARKKMQDFEDSVPDESQ